MNILVTGGTGFMGSWVVRGLAELGHSPVVYDARSDMSFLEDIGSKFEFVQGDITDLASLMNTLKKFKVEKIIHTAALTSPPTPLIGVKVNVEGTLNVFEAAKLMGIERIVYISSKAVYGAITGDHAHPIYKPISEDYRSNPDSIYGVTKVASEFMASHYGEKFGLDIVALRFAFIYGPGKSQRYGGTSIHGQIIESACRGLETRIPQGMDQQIDLVYVKDVAAAIILSCFNPSIKGKVFNIGSGEGSTLIDLATEIRKSFPKAVIEVGPGTDYLMDNRSHYCVMDISKAKKELGFVPQFPLSKGVEDYISNLTCKSVQYSLPSRS